MMKHAQQNTANDPTWGLLAAVGVAMFIPFFIWQVGHAHIAFGLVTASSYLFKLLAWLHPYIEGSGASFFVYFIIPREAFILSSEWLAILPRINYGAMSFSEVNSALNVAGYVVRPFVIMFCFWLIIKAFSTTKPSRMSRNVSLTYLANMNTQFFPQIKPAIQADTLNTDPDTGPFAREVSPIRFAIINGAVAVHEKPLFSESEEATVRRVTFDDSLTSNPDYLVVPDSIKEMIPLIHNKLYLEDEIISRLFTKQLGDLWRGSSHLPEPIKGLYAAFIAQVNGDKDNARKMLFNINKSYHQYKGRKAKRLTKKGLPTYFISAKGADALIAKHEDSVYVQRIIGRHAYTTTVMCGLLQEARDKGKLISSDFLWLKVFDRTLWYTLNQLGGQTGWTEAAGPFAHFRAEVKIQGPLKELYIGTATKAFRKYLKDTEGWLEGSADETETDESEGGLS